MRMHMWIPLSVATVTVSLLAACGGGDGSAQQAVDGSAFDVDCSKIDLTEAPSKPAPLRLAHGTASEEQVYLLQADESLGKHAGSWYTPEYSTITNSTDRLTGLQANQIDAASMSVPPLLVAKSKGVEVSLVASVSQEEKGSFLSTFSALEGKGINDVKDLKGKTIGIPDYGTSIDYWARKAVASAGMDPDKDVKYALVPLPTMEESLRRGTIDVAALVNPFYAMAQEKGGLTDVFDSSTGSDFTQELQNVAFSDAYIKNNPGAVCAWIDDFQGATAAYNKDVKGSKQKIIEAKVIQASGDAYLNGEDWARPEGGAINVADLDKMIVSMKDLGILDEDVDVTGDEMVYPHISVTE